MSALHTRTKLEETSGILRLIQKVCIPLISHKEQNKSCWFWRPLSLQPRLGGSTFGQLESWRKYLLICSFIFQGEGKKVCFFMNSLGPYRQKKRKQQLQWRCCPSSELRIANNYGELEQESSH